MIHQRGRILKPSRKVSERITEQEQITDFEGGGRNMKWGRSDLRFIIISQNPGNRGKIPTENMEENQIIKEVGDCHD